MAINVMNDYIITVLKAVSGNKLLETHELNILMFNILLICHSLNTTSYVFRFDTTVLPVTLQYTSPECFRRPLDESVGGPKVRDGMHFSDAS